jgi:trimeric autotransporter adhesin
MKKLVAVVLLALTGCGAGSPSVTGVGNGTAPGASGTVTDVRAIVSQGENLSFNNRTAGVNDIAINPVTRLPAIIYHDRDQNGGGTGATPALGALKYAYMDTSGVWNVEVVDVSYGSVACGTAGSFCIGAPNNALGTAPLANIMKLAFKSDGTPAIAYAFGASAAGPGDKEIRFAERSSSGRWTAQRAFTSSIGPASAVSTANTVNPLTGVTLLFDASDRPHITFVLYSATLASSQIKYLFRNSSGNWSNSNISNAVTGSATVTALTNGVMQGGAAWCSAGSVASGSPQAPVYVYQRVTGTGGFGHPAYMNCTAMSSSGECTAWSTLDLVNGCNGGASSCSSSLTFGADNQQATGTNGGSRVDVTIEPTSNRPVIAFFTTTAVNGAATSLQLTVAPNACNAAQPTTANGWNAFSTIDATANSGLNGFRIAAKNSATFFATYLLATATVRQSRSTNSGLSWFATGHIVETTTVGAEGMGAAYDSTYDVLYNSYAAASNGGAGAIGHDIRVAHSDPDDLSSGGVQGQVHTYVVIDNTGNAFPAPVAGAVPLLTTATASNGLMGFAYYFHDNNGVFADSKLYYGVKAGTAADPVFINRFVTNHQESASALLSAGLAPSLAYDSNNRPILAYYNGTTASAEANLTVARSSNGGVSFSQTVVDDTAADIGTFPSLATFSSSIGVAYRDVTNSGLKFARWTSTGQWLRYSVDGLAGASGTGCVVGNTSGLYARLAVTSTGRPVIAFQDTTGASSFLRIAVASQAINNSSGVFTWTCLTLDSTGGSATATGRGTGIGLALDSADRVHIIHFDLSAGEYRYVQSSSDALTAVVAGSSAFTNSSISSVTAPSPAAGNSVPTIRVNSNDTVYIAFHDVANMALRLGTKSSSSSSFLLENVEQAPSLGGISTPFAGQFPVMTLNSSGLPSIFYRSWENWIRFFSRESL